MAGKGFTVKKEWDNPKKHAMPEEARVPAEVRLGSVLVAPATVLAPMAGVTDTVFRRFIRHASLFSAESARHVPETIPGLQRLRHLTYPTSLSEIETWGPAIRPEIEPR